ncbi:MAG TPA: hypothetical protein VGU66_20460 [Candidatus Elarobacter sp.]|nr:hypothetical protein [Candidatus Elarobacter sp.]
MTVPRPMRPALTALGLLPAVLWGLSLAQPPAPTSLGLDESWRIGLTLATKLGLSFGHDIVFTFGPLGFALKGAPDPALATATALFTALLAAAAAGGVWSAVAGRGGALLKLVAVAVVVFVASNVTLDYAALIGVVALLVRAGRYPAAAPLVGLVVGAVALAGLLSKYTLGLDTLAAGGAVWLVEAVRGPRRRRRAALLAAAICGAVVVVGLAAAFRFSPEALAAYVRGAAAISDGYSAGMVIRGPRLQVAVALAVGAALALLALLAVRERKPAPALLVCAVMFLSWKHSFVRQDGHILYYFDMAAVCAALLAVTLRRNTAIALGAATTALAFGALVWAQVQVYGTPGALFHPARIARGAAYLLQPRSTEAELAAEGDAALAPDRLPKAVRDRIGDASVNVLPWEMAIVQAERLRWAPLPVFQSYSAYTPLLDGLNRDALVTRGAAFVLYDYISVDRRYPFGEAPATTAELLCRYTMAVPNIRTLKSFNGYALLERGASAHCDAEPAGSAAGVAINVPVAVPPAGSPDAFVVASFALRPTFATTVRTALWRGPEVFLTARFDDGSQVTYRAVAATLLDGVVVSAVPRDGREADRFFERQAVGRVRDVTIVAPPGAYALDAVTFTRERRR